MARWEITRREGREGEMVVIRRMSIFEDSPEGFEEGGVVFMKPWALGRSSYRGKSISEA